MLATFRLLQAKLRKALVQLPYVPRTLALVWAAARSWTIASVVLLVIQGLLPVWAVYTTRWVVNSVVAMVKSGGGLAHARPLVLPLVLMAGILILTEVLNGLATWIRAAQSDLVQDHIAGLIHKQSTAVDLAFYESPEFYDHLHRARQEAAFRSLSLLDSIGGLLQNGITLAAMSAVLIPYGLWLPVALALSTLPAFGVVLRSSIRQYEWRQRKTAEERRASYYDWLMTAGETAAELRLFGLGDYFQAAYQSLRLRLRRERLHLAREESLAELASGILALLVTSSAIAWMVWQAVLGRVTLGDVALLYQAFQQGLRLMRTLLRNVGQMYANSLFLSNLFAFLSLEPHIVDPPVPAAIPPRKEIEFRAVTFRYPGSTRTALRDFSLTIPAGQIVAIVGSNGAGKSTLVKLLCRLYDPEAGTISLGGVELRALAIDELRRQITVLFQDPIHYNTTAAENIGLGDVRGAPDAAAIEGAVKAAGADQIIARLPLGYDNLLGKRFLEGVELSGGEWQRIALARAFLRQSPVLLLDEPTSAMDSWAEAAWLERFRALSAGRTVVIITHRFTTAMRADVIHVMDEGQIVESGSHRELLERAGSYARSWREQMQAREA